MKKYFYRDEALRIKRENTPIHLLKSGYNSTFTLKLRAKIRARDNFTCQRCKAEERKRFGGYRDFPVHHKDFNKLNDKEDNLVTLCESCHQTTHREEEAKRGYIRIPLWRRNELKAKI